MKLGIYLATQFTSAQNVAREIPNLVEQVRVAREHGFSSVWAAHHLLTAPFKCCNPYPCCRI